MQITGRQKRFLRGLGHHLKPVVQVGRAGLTGQLIEQVSEDLEAHELIKVRFSRLFEPDLEEGAESLARASAARLVGRVGRTVLLYRPRDDDPAIELP